MNDFEGKLIILGFSILVSKNVSLLRKKGFGCMNEG